MKKARVFLIALGLAVSLPATAGAGEGSVRVVELYTSQSCSSSPPADRVLGELAKDLDVIALSCNVTYWNDLGWRDTLSKDFCDDRQRRHVRRLRARSAYTPQLVINGRVELVGSREAEVREQLIATPPAARIEIERRGQDLTFRLPAGRETGEVIFVAFDAPHVQSIPTGENAGRRVRYANPIRMLVPLASGQTQVDSSAWPVTGGYAVLVEDRAGNIIAAGSTSSTRD